MVNKLTWQEEVEGRRSSNVSPPTTARTCSCVLGRRCQSSSVTKGMKGCSSRRPVSRQTHSACCAAASAAAASAYVAAGGTGQKRDACVVWAWNTGGWCCEAGLLSGGCAPPLPPSLPRMRLLTHLGRHPPGVQVASSAQCRHHTARTATNCTMPAWLWRSHMPPCPVGRCARGERGGAVRVKAGRQTGRLAGHLQRWSTREQLGRTADSCRRTSWQERHASQTSSPPLPQPHTPECTHAGRTLLVASTATFSLLRIQRAAVGQLGSAAAISSVFSGLKPGGR